MNQNASLLELSFKYKENILDEYPVLSCVFDLGIIKI